MNTTSDRKLAQQRAAQAQQLAELPYLRDAMTARATRVGPGPERPRVHVQ